LAAFAGKADIRPRLRNKRAHEKTRSAARGGCAHRSVRTSRRLEYASAGRRISDWRTRSAVARRACVCAPKAAPRHAVQASHGTAYPTGFACRGAARQTAVISLSSPTYSASAFPPRERSGPDRACVPPDDPPARSGPSLVPISDARAKYETTPPSGAAGRAPVGWPGPLRGPAASRRRGGGSRPWDPRSTTRRKPDGAPATADSKGARDVSSCDISEVPLSAINVRYRG
jgi:hypothetical protein